MAQQSALKDEVKAWIGKPTEAVSITVEKGAMIKLVRAVDDPNPLWQDEEYARNTRYGGIIAFPSFIEFLTWNAAQSPLGQLREAGIFESGGGVQGGQEIEYYYPIRPGDVITLVSKIADIKERTGATRKMLIFTIETTFTNQLGQLVAKREGTELIFVGGGND